MSLLSDHASSVSLTVFGGLLFVLNAMMMERNVSAFASDSLWQALAKLHGQDVQLWISVNAAFLSMYLLLCWRFAVPMARVVQLVQDTATHLGQPVGGPVVPRSIPRTLEVVRHLACMVQEEACHRQELRRELDHARQVLAQYRSQQSILMRSANQAAIQQYQAVLGYAHYLEEHIDHQRRDQDLRYDFDDVCEASFNLRLIAGALTLSHESSPTQIQAVRLADMMQQTMLALAPSLDRRAMQLTTVEVDSSVQAKADPAILSHVVWMMLLGMIRYAEDESTLRIRCLRDPLNRRALLSIVVSELAPGRMSSDERAAYFVRQQTHSGHMFAETLSQHGNVQLAALLLRRLHAVIEVVPLSPYACELCLSLPLAE